MISNLKKTCLMCSSLLPFFQPFATIESNSLCDAQILKKLNGTLIFHEVVLMVKSIRSMV